MHVNSRRPGGSRLLYREGLKLSSRICPLVESLEAFAAAECNEIFSGRQQRQDVKVFGRFSKYLFPHLQGVDGGLLESKQPRFCQTTSNTLKMGTELFPETSENHVFTRLSDRQNRRRPLVFGK